MEIRTNIDSAVPSPCAATIGSFDGVHCGHVAMIKELRDEAAKRSLPLTVVTFASHPRIIFGAECEPFLLTSNDEKATLLEQTGVGRCVFLDFDSYMASMTAERFMSEILHDKLGVRLLAVGYDHHFGHPQEGEEFEQYVEYGKKIGIEVIKTARYSTEDGKISSSAVRRALSAGDVVVARRLLGRPYSLTGTVGHGAAFGRKIGFPTANMILADNMKMLPKDGVYEVTVALGADEYKGVMNIGMKPTLQGVYLRTVEVHILDFSSDIYGQPLSVVFERRLRDEIQFATIDDLRLQIGVDVARVKRGI